MGFIMTILSLIGVAIGAVLAWRNRTIETTRKLVLFAIGIFLIVVCAYGLYAFPFTGYN